MEYLTLTAVLILAVLFAVAPQIPVLRRLLRVPDGRGAASPTISHGGSSQKGSIGEVELTADGIVGAETWARLDPPTVKKGSTGAAVRLLQRLLTDYGYDPGAIDGDFGAKTQSAVKDFQTDGGGTGDGIVGPKTWAALKS